MLIPLTEDTQIEEFRRALRGSGQRHQAAEVTLADRQHRLGTMLDNYARDFPRLFDRAGTP